MSDAQRLYEQHDELDEQLSTLRTLFAESADEFGTWDTEENALEERLDATRKGLDVTHDIINDLEQLELDERDPRQKGAEPDPKPKTDLVEKATGRLAELKEDLEALEKDVQDWIKLYRESEND